MKSIAIVALAGAVAAAPQDWNEWSETSPIVPSYYTTPVPDYSTSSAPVYTTTTVDYVTTTEAYQWGGWTSSTTSTEYPVTTVETSSWAPWVETTTYETSSAYTWSDTYSSAPPESPSSWAVWSSTEAPPPPTTYVPTYVPTYGPTTVITTTKEYTPTPSTPAYTTSAIPVYPGAASNVKAPAMGVGIALVLALLAL